MRDFVAILVMVLIIVGAASCKKKYNRYYCSCTETRDDKTPVTTDYTLEAENNYQANTFCNDIERKVTGNAGQGAFINCGLK